MLLRVTVTVCCMIALSSFSLDASELCELRPEACEKFESIKKMRNQLNGSCSYPYLDKYDNDKPMQCYINTLKARCNKIDDCYVYCVSNDIGNNVGGGCSHICNYANQQLWVYPEKHMSCE